MLRHGNVTGHTRLLWWCFTAQLADRQFILMYCYSVYKMIVKMIRTVLLCLCLCWLLLHTGVRPSHNDFCTVWHWRAVLTSCFLLEGESFIGFKLNPSVRETPLTSQASLAVTLVELTQVWCRSLVKLLVKHIGHGLLLKAVFLNFRRASTLKIWSI